MGALGYLFLTRLKNQAIQFVRQPSKLIFAVLIVLSLSTTFLTGDTSGLQAYRSIEEFYCIIAIIYAVVFISVAKSGFDNGASFFSMADVNLIFVSPVKAHLTLFYAMIQQLGKSLYLGFFILFQYSLAREYYAIDYSAIIAVALGYGITALLGRMTAILIYIAVGSSDKKTAAGKVVFYFVIGIFIAFAVIRSGVLVSPDLQGLVVAVRESFMYLFPVSGFVTLAVEGFISLNSFKLIAGILAGVVFSAVYFIVLSTVKGDYYEDVLTAAEVSHSAITSAREGKTSELTPKKIKLGKIGFTKGSGASAISEKHRIENRRSRILFFSRTAIAVTLMLTVYAFILPSYTGIFITSVYTLFMTVSTGRWMREFTNPYIYMIPEKPTRKLLSLLKEQIPTVLSECAVCFIPVHFIMGLSIAETASMAVARVFFAPVFIGGNLILQRFFGKSEKTFITMSVYLFTVTLLCIPSALTGFFVSFFAPFNPGISLLATVPVNIVVSFLTILASRNVLVYSEYNNR